jgi:hypothetical protein
MFERCALKDFEIMMRKIYPLLIGGVVEKWFYR